MTLITTLLLIATAHARSGSRVIEPLPNPMPSPVVVVSPHIGFKPVSGHTVEEAAMVSKAQDAVNKAVASQCFEDFMVNRKLIQTNGLTPSQVVAQIRAASLTVPVVMYSKWMSRVVGYRVPPDPTVYTNRKFHAGATACSRGSNLLHEWSHVLGFEHDFNASINRPYSVPYSLNAAMEACCK